MEQLLLAISQPAQVFAHQILCATSRAVTAIGLAHLPTLVSHSPWNPLMETIGEGLPVVNTITRLKPNLAMLWKPTMVS